MWRSLQRPERTSFLIGAATVISKGKRAERDHDFLTGLRTAPKALLQLVRQRWSIENEWHRVRDVQLGEDAHRYANRIGAPLFSFLRTVTHSSDEPVAQSRLPINAGRTAGARP